MVINQSVMKNIIHTCKTRSALLTSFLFLCLLQIGCAKPDEPLSFKLSGQTMGTTYHITVVTDLGSKFPVSEETLHHQVESELLFINQTMSTYIPESELMLFNAASVGELIAVSQPLREVFELSDFISRESGGTFDVTVGPLVNLWGFGPDKHEDAVPDAAVIAELKASLGYANLDLSEAGAVRKTADVKVDLSAIAKGYGVDRVAAVIENAGIQHYMVEIGGEIRTRGHSPRNTPWVIAIERPSTVDQEVFTTVRLEQAGMATSGDYRNYFEKDGKRFSHTINPVTGYPIEHNLASVTVIAPTAAEADGWATAIIVAGVEKGLEMAEKQKLAVYMIVKENDGFAERFSSGFSKFKQP